jgi:hypothetical protein
MKAIALVLLSVLAWPLSAQVTDMNTASVERFASLALACAQKEYPNKIAHVMGSDNDVAPPRELTPSFYGCFDWHSSVHGHWLLVRLARLYPDAPFAAKAREVLRGNLSKEKIAIEAAYLRGEGRASFERPYGLAWLLQLAAELREWDDPLARELSANLAPLEQAAVDRLSTWLPKLSYPVRSGEHSQSAFGLGLMHDWAVVAENEPFERLVAARIRAFYEPDRNCPLAYEPSGEDFLSPCIAEADAVRRVLPRDRFVVWLGAFLPDLSTLRPAVVTDPTDGKLAHLDGLNLSRAWMLDGIASALPAESSRRRAVERAAKAHRESGLASVTGEHYEGGHWLGSFATYLVTRRGIPSHPVVAKQKEESP